MTQTSLQSIINNISSWKQMVHQMICLLEIYPVKTFFFKLHQHLVIKWFTSWLVSYSEYLQAFTFKLKQHLIPNRDLFSNFTPNNLILQTKNKQDLINTSTSIIWKPLYLPIRIGANWGNSKAYNWSPKLIERPNSFWHCKATNFKS